jgi:hypothetical protein
VLVLGIKGSYATYADLVAAHPTGATGDAYIVGTDLYVWNGSGWLNVGQIVGPQGTQGIQGVQGLQGVQGTIGIQGFYCTQGVQGITGTSG